MNIDDGDIFIGEFANGAIGSVQTSFVTVGNYPGHRGPRSTAAKGAVITRLVEEFGICRDDQGGHAGRRRVQGARGAGASTTRRAGIPRESWRTLFYANLIKDFLDELTHGHAGNQGNSTTAPGSRRSSTPSSSPIASGAGPTCRCRDEHADPATAIDAARLRPPGVRRLAAIASSPTTTRRGRSTPPSSASTTTTTRCLTSRPEASPASSPRCASCASSWRRSPTEGLDPAGGTMPCSPTASSNCRHGGRRCRSSIAATPPLYTGEGAFSVLSLFLRDCGATGRARRGGDRPHAGAAGLSWRRHGRMSPARRSPGPSKPCARRGRAAAYFGDGLPRLALNAGSPTRGFLRHGRDRARSVRQPRRLAGRDAASAPVGRMALRPGRIRSLSGARALPARGP